VPTDPNKAFKELKSVLISEPAMYYPDPNLPHTLITEAYSADDQNPGGYSTILALILPDGELSANSKFWKSKSSESTSTFERPTGGS
jgi:hypothetical protein